ncbi:hypothetical protein PORY_000303 [Pneumocystis oryctolagi]|uniref:Uncharacterized protein n=1 Tax=Pneumocystis oryctolagi TaxID=42067 RepID=A0ACB7CFY7_9ASCO|nr:hypothetical protein PORY_000303 [Pneumocystis oryctolagi]
MRLFSRVFVLLLRTEAIQAVDDASNLLNNLFAYIMVTVNDFTARFTSLNVYKKDKLENTQNTYSKKEMTSTKKFENQASDLVINNNRIALFVYILNLPTTATFNKVQNLLHTLYTVAEQKKAFYTLDTLDIFVVFANWCNYCLFDEPYNWSDIYILQDDDATLVPDALHRCIRRVEGSVPCHVKGGDEEEEEGKKEEVEKYKIVAGKGRGWGDFEFGGTFDYLHAGHKMLLTMAAWISSEKVHAKCKECEEYMGVAVYIDLSGYFVCYLTLVSFNEKVEMLSTKKYKEWIEPIERRMEHVQAFFYIINRKLVYLVTPIFDIYGATITDKNIEAIVVSEETKRGGEIINEERLRRNMKVLKLFCIKMIVDIDGDACSKLSSTNIREKMAKKMQDGC